MTTHEEQVAQTHAAIIDALVTVGKTKPLNRITISDITRTSGISRGTFYLHYLDKDDLINQLTDQFIDRLQTLLDKEMNGAMAYQNLVTGQPYPVVIDVLDLVAANKPLLRFLLGVNGDSALYRHIIDILQTAILAELSNVKGRPNFRKDIPQSYALSLVTNAIMSIVTTWLMGDDTLDKQAVAAIIMRTLYLSPYEILGIERQ